MINKYTSKFISIDTIRVTMLDIGYKLINTNVTSSKDNIKKKYCFDNNIGLLVIDDVSWQKNKQYEVERLRLFLGAI